jgi:hypothetical protein
VSRSRMLIVAYGVVAIVLVLINGCPPAQNGNQNTNAGADANGNANTSAATNDNASVNTNEAGHAGDVDDGSVPAERLQPADFTYQGAFRLPGEFNWGARGLCFRAGSGGGALLVTGFELVSDPAHPGPCDDAGWDCQAFYGEVIIPTPAREANWEDLPEAAFIRPLTAFDGGLAATVTRPNVYVNDLEFVPRRGTQTQDKLYGSLILWYAEGDLGEATFPTIWFANLDGSGARGLFHVGPHETPFHGRKMGAYLFTVPDWYADAYLGGRTLVTGRSRGTPVGLAPVTAAGGSQGPTLFAFRAWDSDDPSGDLDALPMLYYRVAFPGCAGPNVGDPANCDYPDFTMCDDWTGGVFVDDGTRRAIMLLGYKGLGSNCYDEPPVECHDCNDNHGYHCQPYERQVIFYDVNALGRSARGEQEPWTVVPYTIWRPAEFYLQENPCWNAGGMTFDAAGRRLFMAERGLGGDTNAVVVHVWSL